MSTHIEWTNETWNPIRALGPDDTTGWHCERVSPGCVNCYAERLNEKRFGTGLPYNRKTRDQVDVFLDMETLLKPLHWRRPRKIFVCSMTDLFGEWVTDEQIDRVFGVMALAPQHTFQVLTKRPTRMRAYLSSWDAKRVSWVIRERAWDLVCRLPHARHGVVRARLKGTLDCTADSYSWPLPNVWLGTSVEDQQRADERIPELLATPAAVRFISAEPLLGPLELPFGRRCENCAELFEHCDCARPAHGIVWVIVGGESGPGARPMDIAWARSLRDQCRSAGVAFFYKQGGAAHRCPHSAKGGHLECIPEDLRVREFPR